MYVFLAILALIASVLLILVVLIQNPKEGGLSAGFGAGFSQQIFGVQQSADFLEKATWTLMGFLAALSIVMNFSLPERQQAASEVENQIMQQPIVPPPIQQQAPILPAPTGNNGQGQ